MTTITAYPLEGLETVCLRYLSCWGLHCASTFGIAESAACSLEVGGRNINQNDSMGDTPLAWAAANGHEGVVKILLGRDDIDPNKPGKDDQTPLLRAARNGHERVVKRLLGRNDIDPNKPDEYGRTPL